METTTFIFISGDLFKGPPLVHKKLSRHSSNAPHFVVLPYFRMPHYSTLLFLLRSHSILPQGIHNPRQQYAIDLLRSSVIIFAMKHENSTRYIILNNDNYEQ